MDTIDPNVQCNRTYHLKETVPALVGLERLADVLNHVDAAGGALQDLDSRLTEVESSLNSVDLDKLEDISSLVSDLDECKGGLEELDDLKTRMDDIENNNYVAEDDLPDYDGLENRVEQQEYETGELKSQISELKDELAKIPGLDNSSFDRRLSIIEDNISALSARITAPVALNEAELKGIKALTRLISAFASAQ